MPAKKIDHSPKVEVRMLGEFSLQIGENRLTGLKGKTKRVWLLVQYLLANRNQELPVEDFIHVLWKEGQCGNPFNALKNLVYRARNLLKTLSGNEKAEFIVFSNGTYRWNNWYECVIDTEEFVSLCEKAGQDGVPEEERLQDYQAASALYRGDFLPRSSYNDWAAATAGYYSALYRDCVLKLCGILIGRKDFMQMISVCERALKLEPLEEPFHKLLLFAYIGSGQRGKAFDHYNYASGLFYRELGRDISSSLLPYYRQLVGNINIAEADLNQIKNSLKEAAKPSGAYYCDYEVFKSLYQVQARSVRRTGQSAFILLFTLSDPNGAMLAGPALTRLAAGRLKDAILTSLRRGDAVASYSATQFIVMLSKIDYENSEKVARRIIRKFRFLYRRGDVKISVSINQLDPAD